MEKDMQDTPSVNAKEDSKLGGGCERLKRDEWSEGAVSSLLEAYESKWVLRNRAKLKGQDWEEVARHVSSRGNNSSKSPKTQTQCKNKIESMKKRYRSESASVGADHGSSWPLFSRLHRLMRGTSGGVTPQTSTPPPVGLFNSTQLVLLESQQQLPPSAPVLPPTSPPLQHQPCFLIVETAQNSPKSNGANQIDKEERDVMDEEAKPSEQVSDENKAATSMDTDSSTPALYGSKDSSRSQLNNNNNNNNKKRGKKTGEKKRKTKRRRAISSSSNGYGREETEMGIAESIQLLAEAVVRSEQARMETLRDVERMRMEADARRAEMDLTRTQIMANTQIEIARIFAACSSSASASKSLDS